MSTPSSLTSEFILFEHQLWLTINPQNTVATLHFNITPTRNAMSLQMSEQLSNLALMLSGKHSGHRLSELVQQGQLLVLALRSHCDGVFLSGGDLREISTLSHSDGERLTNNMRSFTSLLRSGPLVSVALLNGLAVGGGSEIAMAADLRLSLSNRAALQFAQTRWGVPAGWGMMSDLRNKNTFGSERRRGIAMAAQEHLGLAQLTAHGLIDAHLEDDAEPLAAAERWLDDLARRLADCPQKLRTQLLLERPQTSADNLEEFDKNLFAQSWLGNEHRSRLKSYFEQRSVPLNKR